MALENPTPEQQQKIFDFKRTIIQGLVTRIDVHPDKTITVKLEFGDEEKDSGDALLIGEMATAYH